VNTITRRLNSPVFYSTDAAGAVLPGLAGVPSDRPLLLVGNHQLFASGGAGGSRAGGGSQRGGAG
jgi:hypothetical protein